MKRREHRPRRCCPAPALDRFPPPRPAQPHGCPGIFFDCQQCWHVGGASGDLMGGIVAGVEGWNLGSGW